MKSHHRRANRRVRGHVAGVSLFVALMLGSPTPALADLSVDDGAGDGYTLRVDIGERDGVLQPGEGELPATGTHGDPWPLALLALAAISAGAALVAVRRSRGQRGEGERAVE